MWVWVWVWVRKRMREAKKGGETGPRQAWTVVRARARRWQERRMQGAGRGREAVVEEAQEDAVEEVREGVRQAVWRRGLLGGGRR